MATTSSVGRSFPTLRYLAAPFRWFFRSRRRVWTAAAVLLAMILVPPLWWTLQLVGLPDIGEPFDVEAFRSFRIPDDRNACVLYREAAGRLRPLVASSKTHEQEINLHAPWSQADPAARRWVEDNREAMDLFRRGTERPDALRTGTGLGRGAVLEPNPELPIVPGAGPARGVAAGAAWRHGGGVGLVSRGDALGLPPGIARVDHHATGRPAAVCRASPAVRAVGRGLADHTRPDPPGDR